MSHRGDEHKGPQIKPNHVIVLVMLAAIVVGVLVVLGFLS